MPDARQPTLPVSASKRARPSRRATAAMHTIRPVAYRTSKSKRPQPEPTINLPSVTITTISLTYGGAERHHVALANGLSRLGHDVTVATLKGQGPLSDHLDRRVALVQIPGWRGVVTGFFGRLEAGAVLITSSTAMEVAYGLLRSSPVALRRSSWLLAPHTPRAAVGHTFPLSRRQAMARAAHLVALSSEHARELREDEHLVLPTTVIPNSVAVAVSGRAPSRADRGELALVFIGRLTRQKGVDILLRALARSDLKNYHLDVYGDGEDRSQLERQSSELGVNATWHGWAPDVAEVLDASDVVVMPSRTEAVPLVALEAMSRGTALIASGVGSLPDLLERGAFGTLVPPTEDAWVAALNRLTDSAYLAACVEKAAAAWRAMKGGRFSEAEMVRAYSDLICSLAGRAA